MRDSHTGAMPRSTLRNAMNGKSVVGQRCVGELLQHVARVRSGDGEADHRQRQHLEADRTVGSGRWSRNQRGWCTSAACEPNRKNSSSPTRDTENSPTMRPCGLSIAVSMVRPIFGQRLVNSPCSHSAAPSPLTLYLAKFEASVKPTRSRTAPRLLGHEVERVASGGT